MSLEDQELDMVNILREKLKDTERTLVLAYHLINAIEYTDDKLNLTKVHLNSLVKSLGLLNGASNV